MSDIPRVRSRGVPRRGATVATGELACALRAICELGVRRRLHGGCLGGVGASGLEWAIAGRETLVARVAAPSGGRGRAPRLADAMRHLRQGHDEGCFAFGMPLSELRRLAEHWGGADAAGYLIEGAEEAARMVNGGGQWSPGGALELLEFALATKITAKLPGPGALAMLARRPSKRGLLPHTPRAGTPRALRRIPALFRSG